MGHEPDWSAGALLGGFALGLAKGGLIAGLIFAGVYFFQDELIALLLWLGLEVKPIDWWAQL